LNGFEKNLATSRKFDGQPIPPSRMTGDRAPRQNLIPAAARCAEWQRRRKIAKLPSSGPRPAPAVGCAKTGWMLKNYVNS